jgi:hypothetical protein
MRHVGLGVVLVLTGCDGEAPEEATGPGGFVLVGGQALRSGAVLDDGTRLSALPAALAPDAARTLILRSAIVDLPGDADVVTYAYGDDGRRDTLILGSDVYGDRLAVDGDRAAVHRFADHLDASIDALDDGRSLLQVDDIWLRAAAVDGAMDGIVEVFPVDITADGGVAVRARHEADAIPERTGVIERGLAQVTDGEPVVTQKAPKKSPSVSCDDPIAGVWRGRTHRGDAWDWHEFSLSIDRVAGTAVVTGTIDVRTWSGAPDDPLPSVCADGTPAVNTARMTAHGMWDGKTLDFQGKTLDATAAACDGGELTGYAIDHFTGKLRGEAIHTVNNDGAAALNRPYVFRRVACK